MTRVKACALTDLANGEARQVVVDGRRIALVRVGDEFFAVDDTCSHANYSLSEGEVMSEEWTIMCWKHGSEFSLRTGLAMNLPATRPISVYEVVIDGDDVMIEVP